MLERLPLPQVPPGVHLQGSPPCWRPCSRRAACQRSPHSSAPACSRVRSRANSGDSELSHGSVDENAGDSINMGAPAAQR